MSDVTADGTADSGQPNEVVTYELREDMQRNSAPTVGTVVRFVFAHYPDQKKKRSQGRSIVVAIVGKNNVWSLIDEGNVGFLNRTMRHDEFMRVLAGDSVISAEVAVGYETFKP